MKEITNKNKIIIVSGIALGVILLVLAIVSFMQKEIQVEVNGTSSPEKLHYIKIGKGIPDAQEIIQPKVKALKAKGYADFLEKNKRKLASEELLYTVKVNGEKSDEKVQVSVFQLEKVELNFYVLATDLETKAVKIYDFANNQWVADKHLEKTLAQLKTDLGKKQASQLNAMVKVEKGTITYVAEEKAVSEGDKTNTPDSGAQNTEVTPQPSAPAQNNSSNSSKPSAGGNTQTQTPAPAPAPKPAPTPAPTPTPTPTPTPGPSPTMGCRANVWGARTETQWFPGHPDSVRQSANDWGRQRTLFWVNQGVSGIGYETTCAYQ